MHFGQNNLHQKKKRNYKINADPFFIIISGVQNPADIIVFFTTVSRNNFTATANKPRKTEANNLLTYSEMLFPENYV